MVQIPGMYFITVSFGVTKKIWYVHLRKNGAYMASVQRDYNQGKSPDEREEFKCQTRQNFSRSWIRGDDARTDESSSWRYNRRFLLQCWHRIPSWLQLSQIYWFPRPSATLAVILLLCTGVLFYDEINKNSEIRGHSELTSHFVVTIRKFSWRRSSDENQKLS